MEIPIDFKNMIDQDIKNLMEALSDVNNTKALEYAKIQLYQELTAKYPAYVPKFSEGLYGYYPDAGYYDDVKGESLRYNLFHMCNKLKSFKALGYPLLNPITRQPHSIVVNNTNQNTNTITISVSFEQARQKIEDMSSLPNTEIEEIFQKINELERIVQSSDRKSKKWENAKGIIQWVADKGVDVGLTLLPLLLQIK